LRREAVFVVDVKTTSMSWPLLRIWEFGDVEPLGRNPDR